VARTDVASDITACQNDEATKFKIVFKTMYKLNKDMVIGAFVVTLVTDGARVRSLMTSMAVGIIESDVTRSGCRRW
jgi:hypothetical protein